MANSKAVRVHSDQFEDKVNEFLAEGWTVEQMTAAAPAGGSLTHEPYVYLILRKYNG